MKGVILMCLANLVTEKFGKEKWENALDKAGLPRTTFFLATQDVEDAQTMKVIDAACKVLNITTNQAAAVARRLAPGEMNLFSQYRFLPAIYSLLSEIDEARGDSASAYAWLTLFAKMSDSLTTKGNRERSVILLAERDHARIAVALKSARQRATLFFLLLILMAGVVVIILALYRKLFQSRQFLVKKAMETQELLEMNQAGSSTPMLMEKKTEEERHEATDPSPESRQLILSLERLMNEEKPYLNPHLTILDVAKSLDTNRTYLSVAMNRLLKTNFPGYINDLRIQEAIRQIINGYLKNHTQEALAKECGFANRPVFSAVFKKHTGVTPSFFDANYKEVGGEPS